MELTKTYFKTNCRVIEKEDGFYRWSNRQKDYIPLKLTLSVKEHPYGKSMKYMFCSFYDIEAKKGFSIPYHRFIWIWYNGKVPEKCDVDHIDGDSLNNDISNLRVITRSENLKGRKGSSNQYGKEIKKVDEEFKKEKALLTYLKEEYKKQDDKYRWHMYCNLEKNWHKYEAEVRKAIIDSICTRGLF